jgi:hypothetical protein
MAQKWKLGPLYMDPDIFDYAEECPVCLRWFVPISADYPDCTVCSSLRKIPEYPNRLRSSALRRGLSLRALQRLTGLAWSGLVEISNGQRAPHERTKQRLLRAIGLPRSDAKRIFPRPRAPNSRKPVAG